jgi:hypothetical protein
MPHDGDRIVDLAERRARRIDLPEEPLIKMMRQFPPSAVVAAILAVFEGADFAQIVDDLAGYRSTTSG